MENYLFEGRWELKGYVDKRYLLVNVYNGQKLEISSSQLERLRSGKDTVSHIITRRIAGNSKSKSSRWYDIDNTIVRNMNRNKAKYGKKS